MVWMACKVNVPRFRSPSSASTSSAASARISTARASTKNGVPVSVSSMPRPMRWNSFAPYRASSAAIAALAADCDMLSDAAARVTCYCSATATKTRNCSSVIHGMMPQAVPSKKAKAESYAPPTSRRCGTASPPHPPGFTVTIPLRLP